MQIDFHYYATYCAACFAGYTPSECLDIAYSAQLVDITTRTFLSKINAPLEAVTTQSQLELADARYDVIGRRDITSIWASFHFLPGDLYAPAPKSFRMYRNKFRLICNTNGELLTDTVNLAKDAPLQAVGIAMHVLADTWAHTYFAGTPSLVINNTDNHFFEEMPDGSLRKVVFRHALGGIDDLEAGYSVNSPRQNNEHSIMNLGHGRAGHLPDYSFIRYRYLPAWGGYREIRKDNPSDYYNAFGQMIHALRFLRGDCDEFKRYYYDTESFSAYDDEVREIICRPQLLASSDWQKLGERLSGEAIPVFDPAKYQKEYTETSAGDRWNTWLGKYVQAALSQKKMVTEKIIASGNPLAGKPLVLK